MSTETTLTIPQLADKITRQAREASRQTAVLKPFVKDKALERMAHSFEEHYELLALENQKDLDAAESNGLTAAMTDRLRLTPERVRAMARALREIAALPDPVGEIDNVKVRPNGLKIGHYRAPLGVVGIIYESRPNVTSDAGALCLKSGNAVILRGGKEAIHSNRAIANLMSAAAEEVGIPEHAIQLVPTTDREFVGEMLKARDFIDVIIPRGGKSLIERISKDSSIPVIKHLDGNCSVYIDKDAELDIAVEITVNSKTERTGVCNAAETLLVHQDIAEQFLPAAAEALLALGVELRGCPETRKLVPEAKEAAEEDWYAEYLDMILAVKVVDSLEAAIEFINHYGSHHTESIVTANHAAAMSFLNAIDSACVHINASTRFSDGGEYGLGAEIGISTDKLHARGPMGLQQLTTPKWVVFGDGQVRL